MEPDAVNSQLDDIQANLLQLGYMLSLQPETCLGTKLLNSIKITQN